MAQATEMSPAPLLPRHLTKTSPSSPPLPVYKIVLIGDAGVGKTALRQRYLENKFSHAYRATLGADFASRVIAIPPSADAPPDRPTHVRAQLWDTAGSERFRALGSAFYRGADACILVYSTTNAESLEAIKGWFAEFVAKRPVKHGQERRFVWACAGCKTDLLPQGGRGDGDSTATTALSRWADHDAMQGKSGLPATETNARALLASLIPASVSSSKGHADKDQVPNRIPPGYTIAEAAEEMRHERRHGCADGDVSSPPQNGYGSPAKQAGPSGPEQLVPSLRPSPLPLSGSHAREASAGSSTLGQVVKGGRSTGTMSTSSASESTVLSIYHTPPSSIYGRHRRSRHISPSTSQTGNSEYEDGVDDSDSTFEQDTLSSDTASIQTVIAASVTPTVPTTQVTRPTVISKSGPKQRLDNGALSATRSPNASPPPPPDSSSSVALLSTPSASTAPPLINLSINGNSPCTATLNATQIDPADQTALPSSSSIITSPHIPLFLTSSLTGDQVDALFTHVAFACLRRDERLRAKRHKARQRKRKSSLLQQRGAGAGVRTSFVSPSSSLSCIDDNIDDDDDDDDGEDDDDEGMSDLEREQATIKLKRIQVKSERSFWKSCCF